MKNCFPSIFLNEIVFYMSFPFGKNECVSLKDTFLSTAHSGYPDWLRPIGFILLVPKLQQQTHLACNKFYFSNFMEVVFFYVASWLLLNFKMLLENPTTTGPAGFLPVPLCGITGLLM